MRIVIIIAAWLWFLAALPQVTNVAADFGWFLILFPTGLFIGLLWIIYSASRPSVFREKRWRLAWLSVPVLGVGALVLAMTGWGLVTRIWLCDDVLRDYCEEVRQGRVENSPRRVGLFWVTNSGGSETEAVLTTPGGFLDIHGLAYSPDAPPGTQGIHYRHLYGPWYRGTDSGSGSEVLAGN